jgi:hypothetical protein
MSLRRERVYILDGSQQVTEHLLDGTVVRQFDVPADVAQEIQLSPDENSLLVACSGTPGWAGKTGDPGGGFLLINLDDQTQRKCIGEGRLFAWAPDGNRVAYLKPWELWVYDLSRDKSLQVAGRKPAEGRPKPSYYERPEWSADGHRIAAGIGGTNDYPTLLLDLTTHEAFVMNTWAKDALWSREPHPFPTGFVASR